jgi:3-isopropylmalate/(R)-2-methylmalate dehydratase small subunit
MLLGQFTTMVSDVWYPAFADIFRNNCLNVGVLPVQVSAAFADRIFKLSKQILNGRSQPPRADYHIEGNRRKESFDLSGYKR